MGHERIAETFDAWAGDGRDEGMEEDHGDVVRQVLPQLGIRAGDTILDLGCGNGWATRLLAQTAAGATAVGIDASPGMIARAEALHENTVRARYVQGRFEALDFPDGRFKRVFSMEALYYAVDLPLALAEAFRVLKPGGTLDAVVDYFEESPETADWPARAGLPMHRKGEGDWRAALTAVGFANVRTARLHDSRGVMAPEAFEPDCCEATHAEHAAIRAAGSLWIHGEKSA